MDVRKLEDSWDIFMRVCMIETVFVMGMVAQGK